MSLLAEKMRKARQYSVTHQVGDAERRFIVRIPLPGELEDLQERLHGLSLTPRRLALEFLDGWDVQEIDLIPGGSPVPVPFDRDVSEELLNGTPALVTALSNAIVEQIKARRKQIEEAAGN